MVARKLNPTYYVPSKQKVDARWRLHTCGQDQYIVDGLNHTVTELSVSVKSFYNRANSIRSSSQDGAEIPTSAAPQRNPVESVLNTVRWL